MVITCPEWLVCTTGSTTTAQSGTEETTRMSLSSGGMATTTAIMTTESLGKSGGKALIADVGMLWIGLGWVLNGLGLWL